MNKKEREICQFEMNFKKSSCWRSNLLNDENKNSTKSVWILEARFTKILGIPRGGGVGGGGRKTLWDAEMPWSLPNFLVPVRKLIQVVLYKD